MSVTSLVLWAVFTAWHVVSWSCSKDVHRLHGRLQFPFERYFTVGGASHLRHPQMMMIPRSNHLQLQTIECHVSHSAATTRSSNQAFFRTFPSPYLTKFMLVYHVSPQPPSTKSLTLFQNRTTTGHLYQSQQYILNHPDLSKHNHPYSLIQQPSSHIPHSCGSCPARSTQGQGPGWNGSWRC